MGKGAGEIKHRHDYTLIVWEPEEYTNSEGITTTTQLTWSAHIRSVYYTIQRASNINGHKELKTLEQLPQIIRDRAMVLYPALSDSMRED